MQLKLNGQRSCHLLLIVVLLFLLCIALRQSVQDRLASKQMIDHRLLIIVPFRDRFSELSAFLPYMSKFLNDRHRPHHVIVVDQCDSFRFNRGALLNVGFLEHGCSDCDYMALHDVDLLPNHSSIDYPFPPDKGGYDVLHVTPPYLHPQYHYKEYMGGILLLTREAFAKSGGFSNLFWGWGREDDEFRLRLMEAGLSIGRLRNLSSGTASFVHLHDPRRHARDSRIVGNQRELTFRRDRTSGMDSLRYRVTRRYSLAIDGAQPASVVCVHLHCDTGVTPYCAV
uniref:Beta-1,4-galactosyltransferase 7 n=2 Tax=Macrostomum lignano TaxID=282301 RepID=A0A1I8FUU9_9PLAT